jgi:hypothetical protein
MSFNREKLPDPMDYFETQGLRLAGPSKWKTTECRFHGGSDSMRINTKTGAWVCMACGVKGGDVLAFHMQAHDLDFVQASKNLGAWEEDGKVHHRQKAAPLTPRAALEVLSFETLVVAVAAGNLAKGVTLNEIDRARLITCAGRINRLAEVYQ